MFHPSAARDAGNALRSHLAFTALAPRSSSRRPSTQFALFFYSRLAQRIRICRGPLQGNQLLRTDCSVTVYSALDQTASLHMCMRLIGHKWEACLIPNFPSSASWHSISLASFTLKEATRGTWTPSTPVDVRSHGKSC